MNMELTIAVGMFLPGLLLALIGATHDHKPRTITQVLFWGWLVFCIANIFIITHSTSTFVESESTFVDVYQATTPYGFFSVKGSVDGSGSFSLFGGSFSISGEIGGGEYYSVKYFSGTRTIKTKVLDATTTDIIIDGTLRLETKRTTNTEYNIYGLPFETNIHIIYKLHIPKLPEVE